MATTNCQVWDEVRTKHTLYKMLEMFPEAVPLHARFEVVVTDSNMSFLATFRYRHLSRAIIRKGLLVKVSLDAAKKLYFFWYLQPYTAICNPSGAGASNP